MKKMIIVLSILMLLPAVSFAAAGDWPSDIALSNGVLGAYNVNADPATQYAVSTAHTQGTMIYASTSEDSFIYYLEDTSGPLATGDLYNVSAYVDGGFASTPGSYTEVGKVPVVSQ